MNLWNLMFEGIKSYYFLVFEVGIIVGKVLKNCFEIDMYEMEIGYLVLYIGGVIECWKIIN